MEPLHVVPAVPYLIMGICVTRCLNLVVGLSSCGICTSHTVHVASQAVLLCYALAVQGLFEL